MKYAKRGNPFRHNGKWAFRYYYYDRQGNKKPKQLEGFATKKEAEEEKRIKEASVINGTHVLDDRMKCKEFFIHWLENAMRPNITYNTYNSYKNVIYNYVIPELGERRVCTLTRTILMDLLEIIYKKFQSTAKMARTVLSTAMTYAYDENHISHNPGAGLLLPGKVAKKFDLVTLTQDEIIRLIVASYDDSSIFMEVLLAVTMGLRKCELSGLKYCDIDLTNRIMHVSRALGRVLEDPDDPDPDYDDDDEFESVTVNQPAFGNLTKQEKQLKTKNSNRYLPVPERLIPFFLAHRKRYEENAKRLGSKFRDDGYVCCSERGEPRCTSFYHLPFKQVLKYAGLPDMRWHDLRRTAASNLLNNEANIKAIQNLLGHATPIITGENYIDSGPSEILAMKRMDTFVQDLLRGLKGIEVTT